MFPWEQYNPKDDEWVEAVKHFNRKKSKGRDEMSADQWLEFNKLKRDAEKMEKDLQVLKEENSRLRRQLTDKKEKQYLKKIFDMEVL